MMRSLRIPRCYHASLTEYFYLTHTRGTGVPTILMLVRRFRMKSLEFLEDDLELLESDLKQRIDLRNCRHEDNENKLSRLARKVKNKLRLVDDYGLLAVDDLNLELKLIDGRETHELYCLLGKVDKVAYILFASLSANPLIELNPHLPTREILLLIRIKTFIEKLISFLTKILDRKVDRTWERHQWVRKVEKRGFRSPAPTH